MPYKIKHRGSGFKVTTPNHPGGFSKHPMSKKKAVAQLRAIKMHTNESEWVESVIHGYWPEAIVDRLLSEEERAVVQFVSPTNVFWWYTATTGELWTREDTRAKLLPASKANEIVQNLNAIPTYRGRVGAIARNQSAGAPPKADIMPGGGVGNPVGDNTAIGVGGGGGV